MEEKLIDFCRNKKMWLSESKQQSNVSWKLKQSLLNKVNPYTTMNMNNNGGKAQFCTDFLF